MFVICSTVGMTAKSQTSHVMLQHLNRNQQKNSRLLHYFGSGERKVKFNDVCESGYSTTTSSDDGSKSPLKQMTSDKAFQLYASPHDAFHQKSSPTIRHRKVQENHQYKQSHQQEFMDAMTSVSMTPSPTSPVEKSNHDSNAYYYVGDGFDNHDSYYDPLHLSNQWKASNSYNDADSSEGESFHSGKRGILKKPRTLKLFKTHTCESHSPFALQSPSSQVSPIRVPAVYPTEHKTPSPLISSDGSRKSAFTPVIPRNHRLTSGSDLSDISSSIFTPVKGPAVADYVTSADIGFEAEDDDFMGVPLREKNVTKQLLEAQEFEQQRHHILQQRNRNAPVPTQRVTRTIGDLQSLKLHERRTSTSTVESTTSSSPVPKVESLINDAVRLDEYLESCSAKDLKRMLREKLESKDPKCIKALATLIPETVAKQVMSHCVRCHKVSSLDHLLHLILWRNRIVCTDVLFLNLKFQRFRRSINFTLFVFLELQSPRARALLFAAS